MRISIGYWLAETMLLSCKTGVFSLSLLAWASIFYDRMLLRIFSTGALGGGGRAGGRKQWKVPMAKVQCQERVKDGEKWRIKLGWRNEKTGNTNTQTLCVHMRQSRESG